MRYKHADNQKIKPKTATVTINPQRLVKQLKSKGWLVVFANKARKPSKHKKLNKRTAVNTLLKNSDT